MKNIQLARLFLTGLFAGTAAAQHQTAVLDPPVTGGTLPYEITLREISLAPATEPTLHSAVAAAWQDLGDPVPGRNATIQWQEPMNGSRRFYRVFDGPQSKTPEP